MPHVQPLRAGVGVLNVSHSGGLAGKQANGNSALYRHSGERKSVPLICAPMATFHKKKDSFESHFYKNQHNNKQTIETETSIRKNKEANFSSFSSLKHVKVLAPFSRSGSFLLTIF